MKALALATILALSLLPAPLAAEAQQAGGGAHPTAEGGVPVGRAVLNTPTGQAALRAEQAYAAAGSIDDPDYWNAWRPGPDTQATKAAFLAVPEVQAAEELQDDEGGLSTMAVHAPQGAFTPERQAVHERVIRTVTSSTRDMQGQKVEVPLWNPKAQVPAGQQPRLVFLIGPPGAGKTTVGVPRLAEYGVDFARYSYVNNDDVKAALPNWHPGRAGLFHEESDYITEKLAIPALIRTNHNVVVEGVGRNPRFLVDAANLAKDRGYKVEVVHVQVPPSWGAANAIDRLAATGRYVPPYYVIDRIGYQPSGTYATLKQARRRDGSTLIDGGVSYANDVPFGTPPRLRDEFGTLQRGRRRLDERGRRGRGLGRALGGLGRGDGRARLAPDARGAGARVRALDRGWGADADRPVRAADRGREGTAGCDYALVGNTQVCVVPAHGYHLAGEWDESKHPRQPVGTDKGREFAPKGAGATGAGFASPNVEEEGQDVGSPQSFERAVKRLDSDEQARFPVDQRRDRQDRRPRRRHRHRQRGRRLGRWRRELDGHAVWGRRRL
jgi:hypothetical protein